MAGFGHVCLSIFGKINNLQFLDNQLIDNNETIVSKIETEDFDCSIIVGTDPISHFPQQLSKKLSGKPIILINYNQSATSQFADVVIPSAITGIESNGLAYRIDHVPIELKKILEPPENILSDEEILNKLIDGVKEGWIYGNVNEYY